MNAKTTPRLNTRVLDLWKQIVSAASSDVGRARRSKDMRVRMFADGMDLSYQNLVMSYLPVAIWLTP